MGTANPICPECGRFMMGHDPIKRHWFCGCGTRKPFNMVDVKYSRPAIPKPITADEIREIVREEIEAALLKYTPESPTSEEIKMRM